MLVPSEEQELQDSMLDWYNIDDDYLEEWITQDNLCDEINNLSLMDSQSQKNNNNEQEAEDMDYSYDPRSEGSSKKRRVDKI